MGTKVNLYKQSGTDDGTSVNFNLPRSLTYGLNARANDDGGVTESDNCEYNTLNGLSTLLKSSSLIITPNSYKEGKLYSVIPSDGSGDLSVTRATDATRVNSAGLVELVPYNLVQYSEQFDNAFWQKNIGYIVPNTDIAPNGTLTADTFTKTGANGSSQLFKNAFTVSTGTTYYFSIYVKRVDNDFVTLRLGSAASDGVVFNLSNSTYYTLSGSPINIIMNEVENEWFRIGFASTTFNTSYVVRIFPGIEGQAIIASILVWGAQLVEGSTAKDYFATETRLNIPRLDYSLGSCPSILVEPQRTNLALYSEQFDNAAWAKTNATITANATTSPSGTLTADEYVGNGVSGVHTILSNATISSSTTYSLSVFCKKGTNDFIQIGGGGTLFGTEVWCNFNLNTGTIGSKGVLTTAEIKSIGNGWYRCTVIGAAVSSGTSTGMFLQLINSETSLRGESNTLDTSVYIWGAQLEVGAYATSYIPTTSASVTRNYDTTVEKNITSFGIGNSYTLLFDLTMATEDSNKILFTLKNSSGTNSMTFRNFNNNLRIYDTIGGSYPLASLSNENTKWAFRFDGVNFSLFRVSGGVAVKNTATLGTARNIGYFSEMNSGQTKASIKLIAIEPSALTDAECEQFVMS